MLSYGAEFEQDFHVARVGSRTVACLGSEGRSSHDFGEGRVLGIGEDGLRLYRDGRGEGGVFAEQRCREGMGEEEVPEAEGAGLGLEGAEHGGDGGESPAIGVGEFGDVGFMEGFGGEDGAFEEALEGGL